MPFTDVIIKALHEDGGIMQAVNNIAHGAQAPGFGSFEFILQGMTQGSGSGSPDAPVIDAQPDSVIHAETDMQGTVEDANGLHDVNAVHHDSTVQAMHEDTATHAETAYHDDASTMGA